MNAMAFCEIAEFMVELGELKSGGIVGSTPVALALCWKNPGGGVCTSCECPEGKYTEGIIRIIARISVIPSLF
jgi:hypothetical protein